MMNLLSTPYQTFIALSRYSRWNEKEGRREFWNETVDRYIDNVVKPKVDDQNLLKEIRDAILNLEVMPSMRSLMTAGPALDRDHMAGYNCSFVAIDHPRAFDEILYILTCGTGVGFSVESQFIDNLPEISEEMYDTDTTIIVSDSRIGWASSFRELICLLYSGKIPKFDLSRIRPKGTRLKVFGGRASGPEPLSDLFHYTINTFKRAKGRKLNSLEAHGIICKIGDIVVSGGVRRSALISLSDLNDSRMRYAKSGKWWENNPEFQLANNSAVYDEKPTISSFLEEWKALYESKSGERGIYYRKGIRNKIENMGKRSHAQIVGVNPCGEIALRSAGLCNLTEIVIRPEDTIERLKKKAEIASILGTIQSTYTNFRYVRSIWKRNAEEERLLGVSLTGIYDHHILRDYRNRDLPSILEELKSHVNEINIKWADKLGINPACATTTVKPSGTVSQLVNSSSGIHPRHSNYYIRRIRQDNKDPITQFLKDQGFHNEPCYINHKDITIFSFPMKSPENAHCRVDVDAISHLELWRIYNKHWSEHQVSVTITVNEDEWIKVADWVYTNFEDLSGISFLPYNLGSYKQAPYQDCSKEEYEELKRITPENMDVDKLCDYECDDETSGIQELACVSGGCEI